MLRELPDEFREPAPSHIYVAIDVADGRSITIEGPRPLPWTLSDADAELYGRLAQGLQPGTEDGDKAYKSLERMAGLQPLNERAIAMGVYRGALAGKVKQDDPGYKLIARLLSAKDPVARRVTLYAVARANPPTLASAELLAEAVKSAKVGEGAMLQFASLRKLLKLEATKPESAELITTKINQSLEMTNGPTAARILGELLESIGGKLRPTSNDSDTPNPVEIYSSRVDFSSVTSAELDDVVKVVIDHAASNAVAAGWLDIQLLRSADKAVVKRTLELLQKAEGDEPVSQPDETEFDTASQATAIPIGSAEHGLVQVLQGEDKALADLAWQVLGRFYVAESQAAVNQPPPAEDSAEGEQPAVPADPAAELFDAIYEMATTQPQTPVALVEFLTNHKLGSLAGLVPKRLVGLLIQPDISLDVQKLVAEEVRQGQGTFTTVFKGLTPKEQNTAVEALYRSADTEPPLTTALVGMGNKQMSDWFFSRFKEGELPTSTDWAAQAGGVRVLLDEAESESTPLAAAAAAGMVADLGGNADDQLNFAQTIGLMSDRNEETVAKAWAEFKKQLYTRVFASAQGAYRLVVTVEPVEVDPQNPDGATDDPPAKPQRIELGLVELKAQQATVALSVDGFPLTVPEDRLAIRVEKIASLKSFESADVDRLPLDKVPASMDLLPLEDGSWSGAVPIEGEGAPMQLGITLERAR